MQSIQIYDNLLSVSLNGLTGNGLDWLYIFFAVYLVYFLVAVVLIYLFSSTSFKTFKATLYAFLSFILSRLLITEIIRILWHRTRPDTSSIHALIDKGNEASFPSGHASASFAIATAIYFYNKKLGATLLVISAVIAVSRVIIGVHFPMDIVGGAVVGVLSAWFVQRTLENKYDTQISRLHAVFLKLNPFTKKG